VYSFGPAYGFFGDIVHCTITTIPCISDRVLVFPFVSLFTIVFFRFGTTSLSHWVSGHVCSLLVGATFYMTC